MPNALAVAAVTVHTVVWAALGVVIYRTWRQARHAAHLLEVWRGIGARLWRCGRCSTINSYALVRCRQCGAEREPEDH